MATYNVQIVANLVDNVTTRARAISGALRQLHTQGRRAINEDRDHRPYFRQARALMDLRDRVDGARNSFLRWGATAAAAVAAPLVGAARLETIVNRIAKTADIPMDGSVESLARIDEIYESVLMSARELPLTWQQIGDLQATFYRTGIKDLDYVRELTRLATAMHEAFDVPIDGMPETFVRLMEGFGRDPKDPANLKFLREDVVDALNYVDNQTAATAKNLNEWLRRVAPILGEKGGHGMKPSWLIGAAATLEQLGLTAERSARTFVTGWIRLQSLGAATNKNQRRAQDKAANVLGFKNAREMQAWVKSTDFPDLIKGFRERVLEAEKDPAKARDLDQAFRALFGFDAGRVWLALIRARPELLDDAIRFAEDPERIGSTFAEFARMMTGLTQRFNLLANSIKEFFAGRYGRSLVDPAKWGVDSLRKLTNALSDFAKENPKTATAIGRFVGGMVTMIAIFTGARFLTLLARIAGLTGSIGLLKLPFIAIAGAIGMLLGLFSSNAELLEGSIRELFGDEAAKTFRDWYTKTFIDDKRDLYERFQDFVHRPSVDPVEKEFPGAREAEAMSEGLKGFMAERDKGPSVGERASRWVSDNTWWLRRAWRTLIPPTTREGLTKERDDTLNLYKDTMDSLRHGGETYYAPKNQVTAPITVNVNVNASFPNGDPSAVGGAVGAAAGEVVKRALNSSLNDGVSGYPSR